MQIERGSTWNKWDFHVHTPYSLLNNQFGVHMVAGDIENFDEYVKKLFIKAMALDVVAIGVTDYFSIEGYKRIRQEYLSNEDKMAEIFPNSEERNKINSMFVFPNIELRLDTFIGEGSHSVNYHVIFSDDVACKDIEENFLNILKITHENGKTLPLTKSNIIRIGEEFKECNNDKGEAILIGLEKITVNYHDVIDVLSNSTVLQEKYMIVVPVDEDLSKVNWKGRDYQTRKNIYQQCDFLMTSNPKTRNWALAKGHEKDFISEFRSLKPCIWGSDAHDYTNMFRPKNDRICWIKAEPTFEGLKQVLYEPEDRVKIQKECPAKVDNHHIIDYIKFESDEFMEEPIYLSEGLNAIIGGKSTGKSILLRHIAKCVDPKQVSEREAVVTNSVDKIEVCASVFWRDGQSGERKIIYIPQSWLNRIVDESEGNSQLNVMIEEILLQQKQIELAHSKLRDEITEIYNSTKCDIIDYVTKFKKIIECEHRLHEVGSCNMYEVTVLELEKKRAEISSEAGISDAVLKQYTDLEQKILELNNSIESVGKEVGIIKLQREPFIYIPGFTCLDKDEQPKYMLEELNVVKDEIKDFINDANSGISLLWQKRYEVIRDKIDKNMQLIESQLSGIKPKFDELQVRVSKSEELKQIDIKLSEEKENLKKAQLIEKEKKEKLSSAAVIKKRILASRQLLKERYDSYAECVFNENDCAPKIKFEAEVVYKKKELYEAICALYNNRSLKSFGEKNKYRFDDEEDFEIDDLLFEKIWEAMADNSLIFKGGNDLETALERLFSDWFSVHYVVKSDGDVVNKMSPGKKALVLLEMLINIDKSRCPILIDQPEDDLDNRSIYKDLVSYLKEKKERQIIVATHNANVVVGADAEEVIIANQDGDESRNKSKRFEYRCGAIENISPETDDRNLNCGVLYQKGVQQQICDILEGGMKAFELRRKKYGTSK